MKAILCSCVVFMVAGSPAWAQSTAEREQQRQAQQAGERHPGSKPPPKSAKASVSTGDKKLDRAKAKRPQSGEAAVSTPGR
jgi:hypothetical protein